MGGVNNVGFHHHHPPPSLETFSWFLRGLGMSDGLKQGWYDSSMVLGDLTSRLTARWTPRGHYRGHMGEYFKESKVV